MILGTFLLIPLFPSTKRELDAAESFGDAKEKEKVPHVCMCALVFMSTKLGNH